MGDIDVYSTAREMAAAVAAKQVSARELLDAHLERIEVVNPALNAVVTLDADRARAAADAADAALAAGDRVGPLHGLPVAHKDTHATGGMRHDVGLAAARRHVPLRDELIVARYKAAGAVRVGKTNVPEFAAGSHTFNPVFGATHNPYRHGLLGRAARRGGAAAALAGGHGAAGRRQRHGRLAAQPGRLLQRRRPAAHAGPGADVADHEWAGRSCRCRARWAAPSPTSRCSCR